MNIYKVIFENNNAISSIPVSYYSDYESVKIERQGGKSQIKWVVIYANDEQESIKAARIVFKDYSSYFMLS